MDEHQIENALAKYTRVMDTLVSLRYRSESDDERRAITKALEWVHQARKEIPPFSTD